MRLHNLIIDSTILRLYGADGLATSRPVVGIGRIGRLDLKQLAGNVSVLDQQEQANQVGMRSGGQVYEKKTKTDWALEVRTL